MYMDYLIGVHLMYGTYRLDVSTVCLVLLGLMALEQVVVPVVMLWLALCSRAEN